MMFGGAALLMWLLPLLVIGMILVVAVAVAGGGLGILRQIGGAANGGTAGQASAFSTKVCPVCRRPMQADWRVCPYDGTEV